MRGEGAGPVSLEMLVALRPGQAVARLGGGAFALSLQTVEPLSEPSASHGEKIRAVS